MERMRHVNHEQAGTGAAGTGAHAASPAGGGSVQFIWGSNVESLELAGMQVGEVFQMLQAPFNIAPTVMALVNGDPVDAEHPLREGDELEFTRPAGEKGGEG